MFCSDVDWPGWPRSDWMSGTLPGQRTPQPSCSARVASSARMSAPHRLALTSARMASSLPTKPLFQVARSCPQKFFALMGEERTRRVNDLSMRVQADKSASANTFDQLTRPNQRHFSIHQMLLPWVGKMGTEKNPSNLPRRRSNKISGTCCS